jgi:hypothetical protein
VYSPAPLLDTRKALKKPAILGFNGGERLRCDRVESCGSLSMFREEPAATTFRVKIREQPTRTNYVAYPQAKVQEEKLVYQQVKNV